MLTYAPPQYTRHRIAGKSAAMEGAIQAEWITTGSTWIFPQSDSPYLKTWVDTLNDQCKCGQGGWEIGVTKTIKPKQCHLKDGNDYNYLCYLANGTTGWANYKWLDTSPDEPKTYIAGPISFDRVEGWSKPPTSIPRYDQACWRAGVPRTRSIPTV